MFGRMSQRQALAQLEREFPDVPTRIITAILDAYRRCTPSMPAALRAARSRLEDARTT